MTATITAARPENENDTGESVMELNCGQKASVSKMKKRDKTDEEIAHKMRVPIEAVRRFLAKIQAQEAKSRSSAYRHARSEFAHEYGVCRPKITLPRVKFLEGVDV